ncbi:MAG: hypothetical protein WB791_10090 [Waddliaceae bacterium]
MSTCISSRSQQAGLIGGSNRSNHTQQAALKNEDPGIVGKSSQVLQQRGHYIGIQPLDSVSSHNQATRSINSTFTAKAWVRAGLVVGTTALVYGFVKALGYFPGWFGNDHHSQNNGIQTDRGVVSRDHRGEADDVFSAVQHDQTIISRRSDRYKATGRDLLFRKHNHSAFKELDISDAYIPKNSRNHEDDILEIDLSKIHKTTHHPQLLEAPTVLNPISDQFVNLDEEFVLDLGNHPIFSNPNVDVFDGQRQPLFLHAALNRDRGGFPNWLSLLRPSPFQNPAIIGSIDIPSASHITIVDKTAFISCGFLGGGKNGLQIVDVSNPAKPSIIGWVNTPVPLREVSVVGTTAFAVDVDGGLQIIDVSNPAKPFIIRSVNTEGFVRDVTVVGNIAFITDQNYGLQIIDVSNPAEPSIIGSVNTPGTANEIAVMGNTAFVADQNYGLQIIDVSNLAEPSIIGSVNTPGLAWGVAIVDATVFVADAEGGLQIIDVSNPAEPFIIGSVNTPGLACGGIAVTGNTAFVTCVDDYSSRLDSDIGLQIIDISIPSRPTIIGSVNIPPGWAFGSIAIVGNTAFVPYGWGLKIIDTGFRGWQLKGAYYRETENIDIRVTATPNFFPSAGIGSVDIPGRAEAITIVGKTAFVGCRDCGHRGLQIIDISSPTEPFIIGSVETTGYGIQSIAVVGNIAIVGDSGFGAFEYYLRIIDVSNPTTPTITGSVGLPHDPKGISIVGNTVFAACWTNGLQVIDISNPAEPSIIGSIDTPDYAWDVSVVDNTAFVACYRKGLQIIDVSNPSEPSIIGSIDTPAPDRVTDVTIVGNTAFISTGSILGIIDVFNVSAPAFIGLIEIPYRSAQDITVMDNAVFIADREYGLQIIDISNLSTPTVFGSYVMPGRALGIAVGNNTAFIAAGNRGLQVIDLTLINRFGGSASDTFRLSVRRARFTFKTVYLAAILSIISAAGISCCLYKKRALLINPFKGKKISKIITTGQHNNEIFTFASPSIKIKSVIAKIPDSGCFSSIYRCFGKTKTRLLPEGLPRGIQYDRGTNTLSGSSESEGVFTIRAIGNGGIIREQFVLTIEREEINPDDTRDEDDNKETGNSEQVEMMGYSRVVGIVPDIDE